jgi:acetyltransferase-like isoleucine patch superfamily enzyme
MISSILCLLRDLMKDLYLFFLQICTRLFFVDREFSSSISIHSRLDVIPRGTNHKRNRLILKRGSFIEKLCGVNTWHGTVVLEEGAGIGIGSIVIGPVSMGADSRCSQNCFISGESHFYKDIFMNFLQQDLKVEGVTIEENAWIGSNCVILPGVRIGKNSVIGAGSVVTKDIPPFSVAVGNPARAIKQYNFKTDQWERICK